MVLFLVLMLVAMIDPVFAQGTLQSTALAIPGADKGVRLDDMRFAKDLHKVLVPAGKTGKLYLIDPITYSMTSIDGFTSAAEDKKGHHVGVTSADEGEGFIFTGDHGTKQLEAINEKSGKVAAQTPLADDPDIIRYVGIDHEVWVTEPDGQKKQIEIFKFNKSLTGPALLASLPPLQFMMSIPVTGDGPESLTIDDTHQRAYTNLGGQTAAFDLKSHAIIAEWPNTCKNSSGTAVDEGRGFLFVACKEGKEIVFDLNQDQKQVGSLATGPGPDLIDFNPDRSHLYTTGSKNATLSVLGVSSKGELSLLGVGQAVNRAHCVVGDDQNNIWVCDPLHGQLLRYKDDYPTTK